MEIRGILFDMGRVLVDFDMSECEAELTSRSGVPHDAMLRVLWDTGSARRYESGDLSAMDFYEFVRSRARLDMSFEEFMTCWTEVFSPDPILPAHFLPTLARRWPMTVVSNTSQAHAAYVRDNYDVLDHFSAFVFSYEVGALKPDPRIFERAVAVSGFEAGNLLFIDDRPENIAAAGAMGIHTHHFRSVASLAGMFRSLGVDLDPAPEPPAP